MGSKVFRFAAAATTAVIIAGCGTTHHFLPAEPLKRHQWQISLEWHYDLNGFYAPRSLLWPNLNAYVGLGKEYNVGFGANFPCFVNHVTLARYWRAHQDDYWSGYFHVNRVLALSSDPLYEIGAAYSAKSNGYRQTISMGLAYGQLGVIDRGASWAAPPNSIAHRILPTLKGSLAGRDIGVSCYHYTGQTSALLAPLKDRILHHNDTLLRFAPGQITSVDYEKYWRGARIILRLRGDSSITIWGIRVYADNFPTDVDDFQRWLGNSYVICTSMEGDPASRLWWHLPILCPAEIQEDVAAGRPVAITRYQLSLLSRLESYGNFIRDNSFGFGAMFDSQR